MTKPALPPKIEAKFPLDVTNLIYSYIPYYPRRKKQQPASPGLQKALEALQKSPKRTTMDMYGLDDFVLC